MLNLNCSCIVNVMLLLMSEHYCVIFCTASANVFMSYKSLDMSLVSWLIL